ncbi:hypothetical protein L3X38_033369 [Prunus dulcis]|uniref:Uncharacterized protein n=1 Tax=Prunus dulcis TaxID=3755 RepID=A0AAD4VGW4_PRUDU|nr:hypothetical protein L3X38_033369 [Prunus dulcis]
MAKSRFERELSISCRNSSIFRFVDVYFIFSWIKVFENLHHKPHVHSFDRIEDSNDMVTRNASEILSIAAPSSST